VIAASDSADTPVLPPRPEMPRPEDCCGSGCVHCVYVVYDLALTKWEREVERILANAAKASATATTLRASAAAS
jgi:hypothetical protein